MFPRVLVGKDSSNRAPWRTGHKPLSLLYSVAFHASLVGLAFLPPSAPGPESLSHARLVELEKDHKLIYYDFRKELPEVSAANPTGKVTTPSPKAPKSKRTIVATPLEKPGKQLVYLPEPRIKLQHDLAAPNLIAIQPPVTVPLPDLPKPKPFQAPETPKTALPPVAPLPSAPVLAANAKPKDSTLNSLLNRPAGPPPKAFIAPAPTTPPPADPALLPSAPAVAAASSEKDSALSALFNKPAGPPPKQFNPPARPMSNAGSAPAPLPNAPAITPDTGDRSTAIALLNKPSGPPPKPFTPPAKTAGAVPVASPAPVLPSAPAVTGGVNEKEIALHELFDRPSGPPPKPFTAPSPAAGRATTASPAALPAPPPVPAAGQPATATVAILGLNPANVPQIPKPEGSRPARIEAGTPVRGATRAELGGGNSPIALPDISIQGGPPVSPATATRDTIPNPTPTAPPATGLAKVQMPQVLPRTAHVAAPQWPNNRSLPAAIERHFQNRVVYITLIPGADTNEDWVLWFADVGLAPGDPNLLMHPPTLMRAGALPPFPAQSDHGRGSIRLTGVIRKDGHFAAMTDLAGAPADRELADALQSWQFGPARRNDVIVEADAVIEIPVVFGKLSLR